MRVLPSLLFFGLLADASKNRAKSQSNSSSQQNSKSDNSQTSNTTLADLIYYQPQLLYTQMFKASNCSNSLQDFLSNSSSTYSSSTGGDSGGESNSSSSNSTQGLTIFAPIDSAWNNTFNMRDFSGFYNCSGTMPSPVDCLSKFNLKEMKEMDPNELGDCLALLAAYLVAPGIQSNLSIPASMRQTNVFVVQTGLNSTSQQNQSQAGSAGGNPTNATSSFAESLLVANKTSGYTILLGGGNSNATIIDSLSATDGQLYLLSDFLLPPLTLEETLQAWQLTLPPQLNQSLAQLNNTTNGTFTLFLPEDLQQLSNQAGFNLSKFIIPQIIYLNQTAPTTMNYTAIDGFPLFLNVSLAKDQATANGSAPVVVPNIPFDKGVIHLISNVNLANQTSKMEENSSQKSSSTMTKAGANR